jgi:anti-sigma regulatory factor (Ser/Thr protein kinase)
VAKQLSLDLEPELDASTTAREEIRAAFGDSLPASLLHDLTVVVTELVGNSVEHGPGEPIQVRLKIAGDGTIRGEIEDRGRGEVAIREMAEDPSDALGLRIVDWLTDRWAVYEGSTHVWFEMGARQPGEAARAEPVQSV